MDDPKITVRTEGGRTTVAIDAVTSLPLPDRSNQTGFGERAAKIAWRTHQGRIDALEVSVRDESGHADDRTWRRAELESAFGPRLAGLDAGREPPRVLDAGDGPFGDKEAAGLGDGRAILEDLLRRTSREVLRADVVTHDGGRDECTKGLTGKPTGEFRQSLTLEPSLAGDTHQIVVLQQIASYWARQGLDVDISGFYSGNEDRIKATVHGVGQVSAGPRDPSDRRGTSRLLELWGMTDCLEP
ncbi:hypothetical protein [Thermomonospora cellulosilytica]|uniref:Uncharacterized protein n=1 Tax=Thermomonospora cellulosilytica TaxID=1411118 RepID=A0A7W3MT19_9ACTN|nr:hypothetical protein [Thermomonospora cellulosilytica]MBA9001346.1 hypothetical protein [Thermomonospora cellulosilytica]